jgi:transcriptional regulator with XRE-family HTH domain
MDIGQQVGKRVQDRRLGRGWDYLELSRRSGVPEELLRQFEIDAKPATVAQIAAIADALEVTAGCLIPLGHPLEAEWDTGAWEVMSATAAGFRAKVCVLGKLAEWQLFEVIQSHLDLDSRLRNVVWNDSDDQPDFHVEWDGRPLRIECKNVRRDLKKPARLRVELQKTRNSKDGQNTRSYSRDKFDVLAACLYNQTRSWQFVFCPTRRLAGREQQPNLLAIYHEIQTPVQLPWTPKLLEALQDARA